MAHKFENHQTDLFEEKTPRLEPPAAQKIELASLLEVLLCEIAAALVNVNSGGNGHDQDHG